MMPSIVATTMFVSLESKYYFLVSVNKKINDVNTLFYDPDH